MCAEAITLRARKEMAASVALLPAALVLGWLSFLPGLAALAAGSAGTVAFLRIASRQGERPGPGTALALIIYSALLALTAVTAREAMGLGAPATGAAEADGHEARLMAGEFALFFVLYSATVLESARAAGSYFGFKRLSPATAIFVFVLYFAVLKLPPYELDLKEWGPLLASASAVGEGRWPYLHHYSVQHGFLNAGALSLWFKAFGPTPLALASFASVLTALSGAVAFLLVKGLTNSRGAALLAALVLVANFTDMEASLRDPAALHSQFQVVSGLYLLRAALLEGAAPRGCIQAFLFGALCLWEPAFGIFMALSFLSITVYRAASRKERQLFYPVAALIAGVVFPVSAIAALRPPEVDFLSGAAIGVFIGVQQVFASGQDGAHPGFFPWEVFVLFFFAALLMVAYRQISSGRGFSRRHLFLFGTALMLPPWLAFRAGGGPPDPSPAAWLLAPALALIFHTAYRHAALGASRPRLYAAAVITAAPLLTVDLARPVGDDMNGYLDRYRDERARWQASCADATGQDGGCGTERRPGLKLHMKAALERGLGLGAHGPAGFGYHPPNFFLARACEKGVPVVSDMDGAIAAHNGCPPRHRYPSARRIEDRALLSGYLDEIKNFPAVVLDERRAGGYAPGGLPRRMKRELLDSGYHVSERHGVISVLTRKDAGTVEESCIVCAPPAEIAKLSPEGGWLAEGRADARRKSFGAPIWDSFVLSALVWAEGRAGLIVGETGNGYAAFYIDPASGTARLSEFRGKKEVKELSTAGLRKKSRGMGSWHDMEVFGGSGGHYQFFVDGEFVLESDGLEWGGVGLIDLAGTARFREVELARGPDTGGA